MSNTNTEVLTTAYEKLQGALTQSNTVLPKLEEAVKNADLSNYATVSDLEDIANRTENIASKQIKYFIPTMSKPVDTAGINSNGVISWIKDKATLKTYVENIKNMGFNEAYLIINNGFISSTEFIIAYNNTDFTNWQDSFAYFLSLLEQNNIKLVGIKLHTTGGYGCVTLEQINNTGGMTLFKTKYKEMVTDLCTFFKDYTDRVILFNEIDWMYLDSTYDDFITECFTIVKNKGMKCSISTINPSHYISISDTVKNNMDFYATNYYPPISDNALDVDLSSMVQKVIMADDYKKGLRYMLRSKKDVFISETGCMDKYDSLCEPWKWQNFIDTASGHNGEVQYMFLQVILNVFNENRIKNVCYWFDLDSSLDWFIKKINGGEQ